MDLVGWVTLDNQSGKQFDHAHIKLMAGDVNKVQGQNGMMGGIQNSISVSCPCARGQVTEKAFEDYHLYSLPQATTLR